MTQNRISLTLGAETVERILASITALEADLQNLIALTNDERRDMFKMGTKSHAFCMTALAVADVMARAGAPAGVVNVILPVPVGALSGITDCKEISGVAVLRCDGDIERQTRWQMTSCHSGFGRSIEGTEPAFLFGFSGNSYSAQNQTSTTINYSKLRLLDQLHCGLPLSP